MAIDLNSSLISFAEVTVAKTNTNEHFTLTINTDPNGKLGSLKQNFIQKLFLGHYCCYTLC